MSKGPGEITVRLKKAGWEIEITCTEQQLKQAIESVLSSLATAAPPSIAPAGEEIPPSGQAKTCRGLIVELWRESWFSENKSLGDVHEELSRRGYHYDRTAVSHALTDLVRENTLTRQGNMRNYTYIQKRPPQALSSSEEFTQGTGFGPSRSPEEDAGQQ